MVHSAATATQRSMKTLRVDKRYLWPSLLILIFSVGAGFENPNQSKVKADVNSAEKAESSTSQGRYLENPINSFKYLNVLDIEMQNME